MSTLISAETIWDYITPGFYFQDACRQNQNCTLDSLWVNGSVFNVTVTNIYLNVTQLQGEHWWNETDVESKNFSTEGHVSAGLTQNCILGNDQTQTMMECTGAGLSFVLGDEATPIGAEWDDGTNSVSVLKGGRGLDIQSSGATTDAVLVDGNTGGWITGGAGEKCTFGSGGTAIYCESGSWIGTLGDDDTGAAGYFDDGTNYGYIADSFNFITSYGDIYVDGNVDLTKNLTVGGNTSLSTINPFGPNITLFTEYDWGGSLDGFAFIVCNEGEGKCGQQYVDKYGRYVIESPEDDLQFYADGTINIEDIRFTGQDIYTTGAVLGLEANADDVGTGYLNFIVSGQTTFQSYHDKATTFYGDINSSSKDWILKNDGTFFTESDINASGNVTANEIESKGDIMSRGTYKSDNGEYHMITPNAGWARGFEWRNNADDTTLGGLFAQGGAGLLTYYHIGEAYNADSRIRFWPNNYELGIFGSRPLLKFHAKDTAGAGIAYNIMEPWVENSHSNVNFGKVGIYGTISQASSPSSYYMFFSADAEGAWNNATLKVDALNKIGIALSGSNRPTETLDVNGTTLVREDLEVSHNITGNLIHGQIVWFNASGTELNFATQGYFYNMTYQTDGGIYTNGIVNRTDHSLMVLQDGLYSYDYSAIGSGQNNHIYMSRLAVNGAGYNFTGDLRKMTAGGDIVTMGKQGSISLSSDDEVSVQVADLSDTGTGDYHGMQLDLTRIGDKK